MPFSASVALDVRVAGAIGAPTTGFTSDPNFPHVGPGNLWRWFLPYILDGTLPPGHRVYCGVTVAEYSTDLSTARAAAGTAGVDYEDTDTAEDICNAIVEFVGSPWSDDDPGYPA